jgi:haloalkane dehalogenase
MQTIASTTRTWRELYPFDSHFLNLGGNRYHYVDEGEGEAVVMLHGNPTWSFYYRHLITGLNERWRTIVPDHMGCGLSDKPQSYKYELSEHVENLEELLINHLQLKQINLVLHDWGGAIGMGFATRHPELVKRIVVLNTAAFLSSNCPWRIRACKLPFFGEMAIRGFNAFARGALSMATKHPERFTDQVKEGYLAPYDSYLNRIATLRFVQDIPLRSKHPTWKTITNIQKNLYLLEKRPMLICWGEKDFCFDMSYLKKWRRYFPEAQVETFPDAGHYVLEDAHERILPLVQKFLVNQA